MFEGMFSAELILVAGALLLVASWVLHWVLLVAGVALIALGIFLMLGGQVAGL